MYMSITQHVMRACRKVDLAREADPVNHNKRRTAIDYFRDQFYLNTSKFEFDHWLTNFDSPVHKHVAKQPGLPEDRFALLVDTLTQTDDQLLDESRTLLLMFTSLSVNEKDEKRQQDLCKEVARFAYLLKYARPIRDVEANPAQVQEAK